MATSLFFDSVGRFSPTQVFKYRRSPALSFGGVPDMFVTSGSGSPPLFGEPLPAIHPLPASFQALGALAGLAPRPFYLVQAREDPGTSISASQAGIDLLGELYRTLDPNAQVPEFMAVDGAHNYNAERSRLATDWLADVLDAQAIVDPPVDLYEHETPVLDNAALERLAPNFGEVTLHDIHAARALETIREQRESQPFSDHSPEKARDFLRTLLMMPNAEEPGESRPIMLDERSFTMASGSVNAQFWLLPLTKGLEAGALTITPEGQPTEEVVLRVITRLYPEEDVLLPTEDGLLAHIADNQAVVVLYLPGFGPLRPTQETLGLLAVTMPSRMGRSLLGTGVEAAQKALDLTDILYPDVAVVGVGDGVDAGNVLTFTTALDERITEARLNEAVDSFTDFLTAPTNPLPAPTTLIPGLAAYVDIADLQRLAGDGRIVIESESDLEELSKFTLLP